MTDEKKPAVTPKHWCWNCLNLTRDGKCAVYPNVENAAEVYVCEARKVEWEDD